MTVRTTSATAIVRLICAVALMMVGFAHKPVVAAPLATQFAAQFAAYVLPDGTLPTLCLNDDGNKPVVAADHGCDACRLSAAILLPVAPSIAGQAIAFSTEVRVFERHHLFVRALHPPSSGPRAPPVSLTLT